MHMKDAIKFALTISNGSALSVIDEMSDAATTFPTPNGGCHPLWGLGHLTLVEGMIPAALFAEKNPAAEWQQYFGENSEPVADARAYPPFAEVREKYLQLRERNLNMVESLTEADLDKPTKAPPKGREREFATYGQRGAALVCRKTLKPVRRNRGFASCQMSGDNLASLRFRLRLSLFVRSAT
jgi:DinB superfamily